MRSSRTLPLPVIQHSNRGDNRALDNLEMLILTKICELRKMDAKIERLFINLEEVVLDNVIVH